MDFCQLLHKAQKNEQSTSSGVRCYSTKFEPPKKEKKSKELSLNVKKFLEKKEREEKQKLEEARRKKEELLALRSQDKKAVKRVNVMLKRTKSANQSVIQDAVDNNNTAFTAGGTSQPDEDDYGYVSQEASDLYNKMMEKYSQIPEEEPKFNVLKKKVSTNLSNTKERVRAALEKEKEEASQPHRRRRKRKDGTYADEADTNEDKISDEKSEVKSSPKVETPPKPKPRPQAPPPMNFADLLKIAEKKQHEPIIIEQKPKEEERLFTKKQKKEMELEREWRERRERGNVPNGNSNVKTKPNIPKVDEINKKNVEKTVISIKKPTPTNGTILNKALTMPRPNSTENTEKTFKKPPENLIKPKIKPPEEKQKPPPRPIPKEPPQKQSKLPQKTILHKPNLEVKPRQPQPQISKPKQFPPQDLKPKKFPPSDLKRGPPKMSKKGLPPPKKGRIIDDDDEEYDSELDDFIDDDDVEDDYSGYIKEIFGYDKAKYRDLDDDVDNMESTFAQQQREEVISKKIAIMEDLEDMRMEEEEKRRKAMKKKRKV